MALALSFHSPFPKGTSDTGAQHFGAATHWKGSQCIPMKSLRLLSLDFTKALASECWERPAGALSWPCLEVIGPSSAFLYLFYTCKLLSVQSIGPTCKPVTVLDTEPQASEKQGMAHQSSSTFLCLKTGTSSQTGGFKLLLWPAREFPKQSVSQNYGNLPQ